MKPITLFFSYVICFAITGSSFAATRTWNGAGGNNNWTNATNWGGTAPVAGDDLIFAGSVRTTPNNDFLANTSFSSISFSSGASAFTLSGSAIILTGGASALTASNTGLTMTIGLNIAFNTASTISVAPGGTLAISGAISGTGALVKAGTGILTLSGTNTFTGGVSLNAGQLNLNSATALGATAGTFTIANGTTINNTSAGAITLSTNNPMTWNGDFTFTGTQALHLGTGSVAMGAVVRALTINASTLTVGGTISGTGGLTKNGTGTMALGNTINAVNWSGINTINAGTLLLGFPNSDNYKADQWIVNNGGTVKYTSANVLVNSTIVTVNSGGTWDESNQKEAIGYIAGSGSVINFGSANPGDGFEIDLPPTGTGSNFSGTITGLGTVNIRGGQGTGKQIFSGLNLYTGPTWIQRGTLSVNTIKNVSGGPSAMGAPTTVANGTIQLGSPGNTGILEYTGPAQPTNRVINLVGSGTIDQSGTGLLTFLSNPTATGTGAKTLTLQGSTTGTGLIPGVIADGSGTTSLAKAGTGTWTISGANTYTGTTTLSGGILMLGTSGVIPNASNVIAAGGTLSTGATNGFNETAGTLTLTANSTIALATGTHSLNFAASNGTGWTAGQMLVITGWLGGYNCTSGTSGKIYTGSSAELSAAKLAQITFVNPGDGISYMACQLATGEIVPTPTPLPVTLISFTGKKVKNTNVLSWITADEINSAYFEVLRSADGIHFESIGSVKAAGNSTHSTTYAFVDDTPLNGLNYYQLAQYDLDGANERSAILVLNNTGEKAFSIIALYPNPASNQVTINFQAGTAGTFFIKTYDDTGKELSSASIEGVSGSNLFSIPTGLYSDGTYFVRIINPQGESIVCPIILQH